MKKRSTLFILLGAIFLLLLTPQILAQSNDTNDTIEDDDSDSERIEKAYGCLEEKAGDCTGLDVQELALTILSTPSSDLFDSCVNELLSRKSGENWGNARDTALAILALEHAGKDTQASEEWLLGEEKNPTDLIWYLQQDSNEATECSIDYDGKSFTVSIGQDKKIDRDAGSCLERSQSNFWLEVDPECYGETFSLSCNQDFITSLIYQNKNFPTIYVVEGTDGAQAFESIETKINSKCFGDSGCTYEATAYAALALIRTGHDVENYVPYLIAMAETNEQYLPDAFIYMITDYSNYATRLVEKKSLSDYWEAKNSAYNKFYDTALALISLGRSSTGQSESSRDWLLFSQSANGCWQNSIRDTAMVLWALEGRSGKTPEAGTRTYCSEGGFVCLQKGECASEDVLGNYYCSSLSSECCDSKTLKSCKDIGGEFCMRDEECIGNDGKETSDGPGCCLGYCEEPNLMTECEKEYGTCQDTCLDNQDEEIYDCNSNQVCCVNASSGSEEKSLMWVWILVLLILIVMVAIAIVKREALKLWWFGFRSKFKKDGKGGDSPGAPGFGPQNRGLPQRAPPQRMIPRRGPPVPRRPMPPRGRPMPPRGPPRPRGPVREDETFKRLKEMSE
jgi:hypothetical protein